MRVSRDRQGSVVSVVMVTRKTNKSAKREKSEKVYGLYTKFLVLKVNFATFFEIKKNIRN